MIHFNCTANSGLSYEMNIIVKSSQVKFVYYSDMCIITNDC